ncbi:ComF family protein [Sphingobacterium spiritivorum]|uniref:ComF family protein n=1 Tax=Sphingobacterium spiritivorum TaxID=258 RepID=UPI003DA2D9EE
MRWAFYWRDFLSLFFPECCFGCGAGLLYQEKFLCTTCLYHLPLTFFHLDSDNEPTRQLRGKCDFQNATAMLFLSKGTLVERILYQLKYNGHPEIGYFLGIKYGEVLRRTSGYADVELVVPIPLHRKRQRKRGYNQAEYFANGLAASMSIPLDNVSLVRSVETSSQTMYARLDRYDNVEGIFDIVNKEALKDKHILLVDDVLTTGATLASAARTLSVICGVRISIATLARA